LPPRWVRRVVLAPAMVAVTVVAFTLVPVWLLAAAVASPLLPGKLRPLRVLFVLLVHLALESVALLAMFGLWVGSGFGWKLSSPWFQRAHYRLVELYLSEMFSLCHFVLNVRVDVEGPAPDAYTGRPLLVCCRHAGPGDSFLLAHALINWYDREPRIVLKDSLQWDPAIDVVLNRLPSRFIRPGHNSAETIAHIADLARGLDHNDAFVIFPEGGNFTPKRRERAINRLHRIGMHRMAERAKAMIHVLAPRPGGLLAALAAAPEADVVWVAHTGVDDLASVADVWRALPLDRVIEMRWWLVPAAEVPRDREGQIEWLFSWWERIDAWIASRKSSVA
jgi:1-acyl-sn-glycerol-3-phosphate acyltransferase